MKSSVFLGMPAVVTILNVLLAMFIIHRHHGSSTFPDEQSWKTMKTEKNVHRSPTPLVNTYTNQYYAQPTWNMVEDLHHTESPSVTTSWNTPSAIPTTKHHVSPTKWGLSRSSLANHKQQQQQR
jgi:hypothetical protein